MCTVFHSISSEHSKVIRGQASGVDFKTCLDSGDLNPMIYDENTHGEIQRHSNDAPDNEIWQK